MEIKETIAKWVKSARTESGLSGAELGAKLALELGTERGHTKANISHWETGKHSPSLHQLLAIAKVTGQSLPPVILAGTGATAPTLGAIPGAMRTQVAERDDPSFVHIKKVKLRLSAGVTGFQADPEFDSGRTFAVDPRWIIQNGYSADRLIAVKVKGESMEPALYEDDLVVLNTGDTKLMDGVVFAVNYEGEAVIKRLSRDAGEWWLTSDNPDQRKYHRKLCRGSDCIIIGRVVKKDSDRI